MLLVNIESIIKNIVISENELYFSYEDPATKDTIYTLVPTNEYIFDTDSFNNVQVFLYHHNYLGFNITYNIHKFKNYCLKQYSEGKKLFKYNGLSCIIEEIEESI